MDYNHYKEVLVKELKNLGLLDKQASSTIDLLYDILRRLSLQQLLSPSDIFTIRTVQEASLIKKFLNEYGVLNPKLKQNATLLGEKGKLLFAFGKFTEAAADFSLAAQFSTNVEKKGLHKYNQFQALTQAGDFTPALPCYLKSVELVPEKCRLFDTGRYIPEKILEIGVWGIGFLCRRVSGEQCVVKCLLETKDISLQEAFRQLEILRNPLYFVHILETNGGDNSYPPYIVGKFVPGLSLKDYIDKNENFPERQAIPFLKKLAQGLDEAHRHDIIHGDIKPNNVLVFEKGDELFPIILNFGFTIERKKLKEYHISLAKKEGTSLSLVGKNILESVEFGAPEQREEPIEGKIFNVEPYSDIYAFAKTASYLLFKTSRPYAQHWKKLDNEGIQDMLETCLRENPKQRYQNFSTALARLSAYQFGYEHYNNGDPAEALSYFQRAAREENSAVAQFALYTLYIGGEGVPVMEHKAEEWKKRAFAHIAIEKLIRPLAETGDVIAQTFMGYIYHYGVGVEKSRQNATSWCRKAAEKGNNAAQVALGYFYHKQNNDSESMRWYKKAAEKGYAIAQYVVGHMYQYGQGIEQNFGQAINWYRKSAEQNYAPAQNSLGHMYRQGFAIAVNYGEAEQWAQSGLEQDYREAVNWYQKSANKGYAVAQANLGCMYLYGLGVDKDYHQAKEWLKKAAEKKYFPARKALDQLQLWLSKR